MNALAKARKELVEPLRNPKRWSTKILRNDLSEWDETTPAETAVTFLTMLETIDTLQAALLAARADTLEEAAALAWEWGEQQFNSETLGHDAKAYCSVAADNIAGEIRKRKSQAASRPSTVHSDQGTDT